MTTAATYRFGRAEINPATSQLFVDAEPVTPGARAFDVLLALIERRDRLVSKNELLELVWPGLVVEENNLQVQVSALRKLLGSDVIATIPGRGYRFTAPLETAFAPTPHANADDAPAAREPTAAHSVALVQGNLPVKLAPLYGRDADIDALAPLLERHALVTIVGAGGIGKSRLALAVAHRLAGARDGGAWMVELAGLSDPALVASTVAQALGLSLQGQAQADAELAEAVRARDMLLVIDNCEHLLDAVATLAERIMERAPMVTLLATSQEPLHVGAEQQYRLLPLAIPPDVVTPDARDYGAVALFEARVRAADPRFEMTPENLVIAIDICRRLDGLPLAIELAAARVATLGLAPVRAKLDARFKLLTANARATLRRHQTLRAALEWSHALLDHDEKKVFRRLGVFAGGFTIEAAQAVASDGETDEWAVLDRLSALVDKSLVVAEAADTPRYRLLESARAFALEQLAAVETADIVRRHAEAMAAFLERVDNANLDGELRSDQYRARVLPDLDNLRAAHAWAAGTGGDRELAIALAAHAGSLIDYAPECADWLLSKRALVEEAQGSLPPALEARYCRAIVAGNMFGRLPQPMQREAALRARALYKSLGLPRRVFSCQIQLARHQASAEGDFAAARATADAARALLQPDWPAEFHVVMLRLDARIALEQGAVAEAVALYRESGRLSAAAGDWRLVVIARNNIVDALWRLGPLADALHEARALLTDIRQRPAVDADVAPLLANVIGIEAERGNIDGALAAAVEALPIMRRAGEPYIEEWIFLFAAMQKLEPAARLLGALDAHGERTGVRPQHNERRLVDAARRRLEDTMPAEALGRQLSAGLALGRDWCFNLIEETLAALRAAS